MATTHVARHKHAEGLESNNNDRYRLTVFSFWLRMRDMRSTTPQKNSILGVFWFVETSMAFCAEKAVGFG